jgi:hypothetical protein
MRLGVGALIGIFALGLGSCDRASHQPVSLVGATRLPSLADLRKETIVLAREGGTDGKEVLNIEILPGGEVVTARYRRPDMKNPVAKEQLQLSSEDVGRLRLMLWRLRPDGAAPADKTIPLGCRYVFDAGSEWDVAYVREDRPDELIMFSLPHREYCKTPAYAEARELIGAFLKALPSADLVERFPAGRSYPLGTYSP